MKLKIYTINNNELLTSTLRDADYLDAVTPSIPLNSVIADADLPTLGDNQAYQITGERNNEGHYTASNNVEVVADYRNIKCFNTETGKEESVKDLGELPSHLTTEERPSEYHSWNGSKWTLTKQAKEQQLNDAKRAKCEQVNQWRGQARYADIDYDNAKFQADDNSQQLITSSVALFTASGGTPEGFVWLDANNVPHQFSLADLVGLGATIANRTSTLYAQSWAIKASIEQAQTLDDLESIAIGGE